MQAGNVCIYGLFRVALILRYLLKGTQPFGRRTQYRPGAKNVRIGEKVDLNNVHLVRHGIVMLVRTSRLVCLLPPNLRAIRTLQYNVYNGIYWGCWERWLTHLKLYPTFGQTITVNTETTPLVASYVVSVVEPFTCPGIFTAIGTVTIDSVTYTAATPDIFADETGVITRVGTWSQITLATATPQIV